MLKSSWPAMLLSSPNVRDTGSQSSTFRRVKAIQCAK
jgi:hypothetical protein